MIEQFAPLDKSYCIRMAVLDLLTNRDDTLRFLGKQKDSELCTDLSSVLWLDARQTESATLFRLMTFAAWKFQRPELLMRKEGTLKTRKICDDPTIVTWSQEDLLTLDNGTSQWASAAVICGDERRLDDAPEKLKLTYRVMDDYRSGKRCYGPDPTILAQMKATETFVKTGRMEFTPKHSEDYCFARAFGLMSATEGEQRWPSLRGHESDRIEEMEVALKQTLAYRPMTSQDHRVIQAVMMAMPDAKAATPECVAKSWPTFWKFMTAVQGMYAKGRPRDYKRQHGCWDCDHVFVQQDYGGDLLWCAYGAADTRPPCGETNNGEEWPRYNGDPADEEGWEKSEWVAASDAWDAWSRGREVSREGSCRVWKLGVVGERA